VAAPPSITTPIAASSLAGSIQPRCTTSRRSTGRAASASGRSARIAAGQTLFRAGDKADFLYFLAEGRIEFVEIGEVMEPGRLFGEIAFFAPDKRRSMTARCVTACTVLHIDETTFKQLYYQNPAFGFEVVSLVAGRLMADVHRLQASLAASRESSPEPLA